MHQSLLSCHTHTHASQFLVVLEARKKGRKLILCGRWCRWKKGTAQISFINADAANVRLKSAKPNSLWHGMEVGTITIA